MKNRDIEKLRELIALQPAGDMKAILILLFEWIESKIDEPEDY